MVVRDDAEMKGRITPEGVDAFRNRIGILIPEPPPFNSEAHLDSIRHFAGCYGDENPLYCDRQYAKRTRWGGLIAPPLYIMTLGETTVPPIPPEVRKAGAGALRGVPNYLSGGRWEWVRPIQEGDQVRVNYFIEDVEEKRSQFGGGKAVVVHHRKEFINQRDEMVGIRRYYFFHTEREASEKAAKYMDFEPTYYTEEMNQEIDDAYENEYVRGPDTLYWEDVEPDMSMPVMVKGPLSTMDIVTWHMGIGWGVFRVGSYRIGYKNRKRVPAFYTKTEDGFWAPAQRLHWDNDRARKVGNPRAYDYGNVRTSWIIHYLTNWMGDDGFLWRQSDEARKFNYHGDTTWVRGKVLSKRQEGERNIVELEVWCENQRGEVSSPGSGTVLLPSRERGPVQVPAGGTEPSGMKTEFAVDIPGCVW